MYYSENDRERVLKIGSGSKSEDHFYRTPWRRDYGRLIHSASFRRLQGKTQLFPGRESDFFRNRLTHSLEVAQIAKSIALKINHDLQSIGEKYQIQPDIVEFAGLAHDLGHPPFGHFGEEILDQKMINCGGFEGNAQTLRLITKIEKKHQTQGFNNSGISHSGKDNRVGLNLTVRSIASILKYDKKIPIKAGSNGRTKPVKGYYASESDIVNKVKSLVCSGKNISKIFHTIECQIMDIADDISYSTYDLEDSFKAGFLEPIDLLCADTEVLANVANKVCTAMGYNFSKDDVRSEIAKSIFFDIFKLPEGLYGEYKKPSKQALEELHFLSITNAKNISRSVAQNGYDRTELTSSLVNAFIKSVEIDQINRSIPALSTVKLTGNRKIHIEILKNFVYESQILSPKIQIAAYRSKEIIETIFETLSNKKGKGYFLLPTDYRQIYEACNKRQHQMRTICDFISGMTDRYAIEFYGRLTSENPETIFKPL
jgi:dGTPase